MPLRSIRVVDIKTAEVETIKVMGWESIHSSLVDGNSSQWCSWRLYPKYRSLFHVAFGGQTVTPPELHESWDDLEIEDGATISVDGCSGDFPYRDPRDAPHAEQNCLCHRVEAVIDEILRMNRNLTRGDLTRKLRFAGSNLVHSWGLVHLRLQVRTCRSQPWT